jgi:hypothetical protein
VLLQVEFFCAGPDVRKLVSNCNGMWNRHQLKDEIEDHTTPGEQAQPTVIYIVIKIFMTSACLHCDKIEGHTR